MVDRIKIKNGMLARLGSDDLLDVIWRKEANLIAMSNGHMHLKDFVRRYEDGTVLHLDNKRQVEKVIDND